MEIFYSPGTDHFVVFALAGVVLLAALIGVLASLKPRFDISYEWVKDEESSLMKFKQTFTRSFRRLWVSLILFGVAVVGCAGVSAYFYQLELQERAELAAEAGLTAGEFQTLLNQAEADDKSDVVQNDEEMFVQVSVNQRNEFGDFIQRMKITVTESDPTEGTEKE